VLTILIVAATTLVGTLCNQVEVILAYKGAIFGSLMVYIFPSLMHTSLTCRHFPSETAAERMLDSPHPQSEQAIQSYCPSMTPSGSLAVVVSDGKHVWQHRQPPVRLSYLVHSMFTSGRHLGSTVLLIWGTVAAWPSRVGSQLEHKPGRRAVSQGPIRLSLAVLLVL